MSKFMIAARIAELGEVNTAFASRTASPAEVGETLLRRWYKRWRFHKAAPLETDATASAGSQSIDEESSEPDTYRSTLYDLAASNPHLIAASLFSRKRR